MPGKKRTGGPRTSEGKLTASRNAIKSGVYSATIILPGENERDFLELKEQFIHDFGPQDIAEAAMVHDLAVLTWKRLRLERLEHSALMRRLRTPIDFMDEFGDSEDSIRSDCRWLANDLSQVTPDFVARYRAMGKSANWLSEQEINTEVLEELKASHQEFVDEAILMSEEHFEFDEPVTVEGLGETVMDEGGSYAQPFLKWAAEELESRAEQVTWVADRLGKVAAIVAGIRDQRLLSALRLPNASRASDDLSRAFFRTLGELRRQQHWRRQMNIVDVTPQPDTDAD